MMLVKTDRMYAMAVRIKWRMVAWVVVGCLVGCVGSSKKDAEQARQVTPGDFVQVQVGVMSGETSAGELDESGEVGEVDGSGEVDGFRRSAWDETMVVRPKVRVGSEEDSDGIVLTPIRPQARIENGGADQQGRDGGGEGMGDFVVDGMVGQINGRALYVGTVLGVIDEQLTALGKGVKAGEFDRLALELIATRLRGMILDQLILGEAERDLGENERMGLRMMMKNQRGRLLRLHGQGSPELADHTLLERTGKGLEETLSEFRQQVVVERYMREKFWPKVNVLRKDVERVYKERFTEFNPKALWTIHLIRATEGADADQIEARLGNGEGFWEVACDPANRMRVKEEGMVVQENAMNVSEVNAAFMALDEGEYSSRIDCEGYAYWVYLVKVEQGQVKALREVFTQIERDLKEQQFHRETLKFREMLFKTGNFDPLDEMLEAVFRVAKSRYSVVGMRKKQEVEN